MSIPWSTHINFASALLLHSCVTVLLKETLNLLEITRRLLNHQRKGQQNSRAPVAPRMTETSAILDGYTSILSADTDGELAELYFTNTGFALLAVSLASSVVMNLLLPDLALNMIVAGTFILAFVVSLAVCNAKYTLPLLALRRAGRFIWSDTPFINFFSLIYIATVLKGQSTLRLQDYVTFRSIAVFELVFMKARLASADIKTQISLIRKLIASERVLLHVVRSVLFIHIQSVYLISARTRKVLPRPKPYPSYLERTSKLSALRRDSPSCFARHRSVMNPDALRVYWVQQSYHFPALDLSLKTVREVGSFSDSQKMS